MIFENVLGVLGVHGKASNLAVRTEMGSLPVCVKAYSPLLKRLQFGYCTLSNQIRLITLNSKELA